jgi:hypothetical protein
MAAGKPKGGRGKKAPYATKLMRVPEPIAAQVDALGLQYQGQLANTQKCSGSGNKVCQIYG